MPQCVNCESRVPVGVPCVHLGEQVCTVDCEDSKERIALFLCREFGQATLEKQVDGFSCCRTCASYQPANSSGKNDARLPSAAAQ